VVLSRRIVIEKLKKADLLAVAPRLGVNVPKRHRKSQIADLLLSSQRFSNERLFGEVTILQLRVVCPSAGLDPRSRSRQCLVDRLLSASSTRRRR
jgi:hypothetical protein